MKQIPLSGKHGRGLHTIIDDEDYELFSQVSWQLNNIGYAIHGTTVQGRSRSHLMHRLVMKAVKGEQVDHINGNKLDNRRANLRFCTQSQNRQNSSKQVGKYSKFKGVRYSPNYPKAPWHVRIKGKSDKEEYIGQFTDEIHAAICYDLWATDIYGEFAKTNFPVIKDTLS